MRARFPPSFISPGPPLIIRTVDQKGQAALYLARLLPLYCTAQAQEQEARSKPIAAAAGCRLQGGIALATYGLI